MRNGIYLQVLSEALLPEEAELAAQRRPDVYISSSYGYRYVYSWYRVIVSFFFPTSLSSSSLSSGLVVSSSVVSGEKHHEPIPAHGQKTAQRGKELSPDHGQKTAQRSEEMRHRTAHTQGSGRSSDFIGVDQVGFERQGEVERCVEGGMCGGLARDVGNGARTHDKEKNSEFQCKEA